MSRFDPFQTTAMVPLVDIVIRESWQVRKGLTGSTVERYAAIYKVGGSMAPVTLARINGGLVLVDGAHRIEALRSLESPTVEATIEAMNEHEAQWAAASANLEHGLPLKKKELRAVFGQYIATGQHRKGRGKVKSLRDIVDDIPGISVGTVRNWFMKDHPVLYRRSYAGSAATGHSHGGLDRAPRPTQRQLDLQAAEGHIRQVAALVSILPTAADKKRVAKLWESILGPVLRCSPCWTYTRWHRVESQQGQLPDSRSPQRLPKREILRLS